MTEPFDIHEAVRRLRPVVADLPKAALFDLYDQGFTSLFEQLVACIISIRTFDEVTTPVAQRLFARARTPEAMLQLTPADIDALIVESTYHEAKSYQIHTIARRIVEDMDGHLPPDFAVLTDFKGVGPKCANLALGIAAHQPRIGVDIHVHRVTNRWGYVKTTTPEKTLLALEQQLPVEYAVEINRLLVPFGKHVCTGSLPRCSTCPLASLCAKVGVTRHR
ncbi:endonuclease-3 [Catalinimonas alkaloidigena]|uniref:Endonuclease-3 n=1 Tax=Catalinimonas alkaloidigena TaxID=1075417 RepID=A0A1G9A6W1_9BACT|nr:endonuclease III [Catalinimonas alkaloidigena]SDK23122.1 endonuclease-3 [Catalinimonas alkaloidigena]